MTKLGPGGAAPEYLTHREVAALLRTTENALSVAYTKRKAHLPNRYKFGRRLLYKRAEVEACIKPLPQ